MKRVLVLSKTKMQDNRVCVGGVDLDNRCSVRLLDYSGHHESIELCPYNLLDIWEVEYCKTNRRPAPHLEDVNVIRRQRVNENIDASNLLNILSNGGVNIYNKGSLFSAFDGKLCSGGSHSLYINHNNGVPDHSTCFWVSDKTIRQSRFSTPEKVKFEYCHNDVWYQIAYVGFEPVPDVIPAGTLVRLSLANWWHPEGQDEDRCYLQISSIYIGSSASSQKQALCPGNYIIKNAVITREKLNRVDKPNLTYDCLQLVLTTDNKDKNAKSYEVMLPLNGSWREHRGRDGRMYKASGSLFDEIFTNCQGKSFVETRDWMNDNIQNRRISVKFTRYQTEKGGFWHVPIVNFI